MKRILSLILTLIALVSVLSLSSCGRSEEKIEEEMREFCYEYYVEHGNTPEEYFEKCFSKEYGETIGGKNGYECEYIIGYAIYEAGGGLGVYKFKKISDARKWADSIESNPKLRYYCVRKGSYVVGGYDEDAVNGLAERIF